jgi:hypothetical protein
VLELVDRLFGNLQSRIAAGDREVGIGWVEQSETQTAYSPLPKLGFALLNPTYRAMPSADFSTVLSSRFRLPSFDTLKHRGDLPG